VGPIEKRCKGRGEWNTYDVVAVDGVIKLSVNGKFVNGISHATQKKGYLCLESEGAEIHFRNIRIMEQVASSRVAEPLLDIIAQARATPCGSIFSRTCTRPCSFRRRASTG